jgi:hypothetical protein
MPDGAIDRILAAAKRGEFSMNKKMYVEVDNKEVVLSFQIQNTEEVPDMVWAFLKKADEQEQGILKLREMVRDYMEWLEGPDYQSDGDSDWTHYIYETAVEAVLGEKAFDRINAAIAKHESDYE